MYFQNNQKTEQCEVKTCPVRGHAVSSLTQKRKSSDQKCFIEESNRGTAIITHLLTAVYVIIHLIPDQNLLENGHC